MKNFSPFLFLLVLALIPLPLSGSAIYQNDNQSAEHMRCMHRSHSTDVDAAYYNPAGLAFMKANGLYLYLGNQIIEQERNVTDATSNIVNYVGDGSPVTFKGRAYTYLYPVGYIIYKSEDMALYGHFGIVGAGASAEYDKGLPGFHTLILAHALPALGDITTYDVNQEMKAYAVFIGASAGAAYRILDNVSVSLGGRYIYAIQDTRLRIGFNSVSNGTTDLVADGTYSDIAVDSRATGYSLGLILGADIKASEKMNIGMKLEYYTPMKVTNQAPDRFEAPSALRGPLLAEFGENKSTYKTLPMSFSIGIGYALTPAFSVIASGSYYFNTWASWGTEGGSDVTDTFNNGYGFGLAVEYEIISDLIISFGGSYSISGYTKESRTEGEYNPPVWAFGTGATWHVYPGLSLTIGGMYTFYENEKGTSFSDDQTVDVPYTWNIALGLTWKVL